MTKSKKTLQQGLNIVIITLGLIILLELVSDMVALGFGSFGPVNVVRLFLTLGLCWPLYMGILWARILLPATLLVSSIMLLFMGFTQGDYFAGVIGFFQLPCALVFWVVPDVNAYYEYVAAQLQ